MNKSHSQQSLDVVIPGLFSRLSRWTKDYGQDCEAPALEQLLNKAEITEYSQSSHEALVLSLVLKYVSDQVPYAVIRGGEVGKSLCADPVHFSASMNDVVVHRVDLGAAGRQEFEALINQHVAENDQQFALLDSGQGLLSGRGLAQINTTPLSNAAGHSVQDKLPNGEDASKLQTLATEIQMLLFDSPVAEQLQMTGQLPVNGLWFWGEGEFNGAQATDFSNLIGGQSIQNLAEFIGLDFTPEPESFNALVKTELESKALIQLSGLRAPSDHDDFHDWQQSLDNYEQMWFKPLLVWLKKNPKADVRLYDDIGQCFHLNAKSWYKRFVKTRSLNDWCNT